MVVAIATMDSKILPAQCDIYSRLAIQVQYIQ